MTFRKRKSRKEGINVMRSDSAPHTIVQPLKQAIFLQLCLDVHNIDPEQNTGSNTVADKVVFKIDSNGCVSRASGMPMRGRTA